eukprot:CAMPEP_0172171490 /NCGR_PEP_ID=MMETSP1050-20130122/11923_1 /TAXON_ID=233186 /ORGANISM="Cryptomonas curvata, Strain CCAP979/52" /LENGTH=127 /DNA_ID=CAMNT_0012842931 /DNA_START=472 /DNA_END=856 /DNA_ORIENTATION=+
MAPAPSGTVSSSATQRRLRVLRAVEGARGVPLGPAPPIWAGPCSQERLNGRGMGGQERERMAGPSGPALTRRVATAVTAVTAVTARGHGSHGARSRQSRRAVAAVMARGHSAEERRKSRHALVVCAG